MKLIVTEKNQTARRIAEILSSGQSSREGGPRSTLYSFSENGEEVKCIGMRGHVLKVDFPERFQKWEEVDPRELVNAELVKIPTEKALVNKLKQLARQADSVVIATDYDREGELIGLDVRELIKEVNPDMSFSRARFSALTESQIIEAFAGADTLHENLARAGEARQEIDLIWGASLTRFISLAAGRLWQRFLSAGRVQSPTLALLVEREREIKEFNSEEYWQVKVVLGSGSENFTARHKTERFTDRGEAEAAFSRIGDTGKVTSIATRDRKIRPPAPFSTTSFITAASSLRINPARAMRIAENLYSMGYISYPRVDNTVYPDSLDLRGILTSLQKADEVGSLASELLARDDLKPTRGKKFSTDHPPIYPARAATRRELEGADWKVYELVARRFMATLARQASARSTRADIDIGGEPFVARGDVVVDEGFMRYYPYARKKDEELPALSEGDVLKVAERELEQKETQPPPRLAQGKLIQKMEDLGLGTKSTRHSIIQNLIDRGYAFGNPLRPSETGIAVTDTLRRHARMVTTPDMTSELEQDMDLIADGRQTLDQVVDTSRDALERILRIMAEEKEDIAREIREGVRSDLVLGQCPACEGELRMRTARKSRKRFVGCANYPDCSQTYPLPQKGKVQPTGEVCPECRSPRIRVITKGRRPWELCLDPECPTKEEAAGQGDKQADAEDKEE